MTASNREEQIPKLGTPPRARRRPRPRKSGCLTIRITEQNDCRTIGLISLQKTQAHRGRRTTTSTLKSRELFWVRHEHFVGSRTFVARGFVARREQARWVARQLWPDSFLV